MAILLKECECCHRELAKISFYTTKSKFFPSGLLNICKECLRDMLKKHPDDLEFADKLCQWADIPFNVDKWTELYPYNKEGTFDLYFTFYNTQERRDISWASFNKRWVEAYKAGTLTSQIKVFSQQERRELQNKWGPYDDEELNYLEQLLSGIMQTQQVNGKLQMDQAIKLCKISLIIDQRIRAGEDFKDYLTNYDKLIKIADFTPKNVKNANDFDSAGEIFAYLEKTGWQNQYYDDVTRDVVDKTIKNMQSWLRYLYTNETNIAEDIQQRIDALKLAKDIENDIDMTSSDEDLDTYENEAYDINEEFEPEI